MSWATAVAHLVARPAAWLSARLGIGRDKSGHVIVGAVLAAGVTAGLVWLGGFQPGASAIVGALVSGVIGAAKEAYDAYRGDKYTADGMDAVATLAGGAVGAIVAGVLL